MTSRCSPRETQLCSASVEALAVPALPGSQDGQRVKGLSASRATSWARSSGRQGRARDRLPPDPERPLTACTYPRTYRPPASAATRARRLGELDRLLRPIGAPPGSPPPTAAPTAICIRASASALSSPARRARSTSVSASSRDRVNSPTPKNKLARCRRIAITVPTGTDSPRRAATSARLTVEGEGLPQPERLSRLLRRLQEVLQRPLPVLGPREMVREHLVVLGETIGVELLDGRADESVQLAAPLDEQRGVGDVLGQRVLEHVGQLGEHAAARGSARARSARAGSRRCAPELGEAVDKAPGELAADHRGELERALGRLGEPVDARGDHVLDRSRDPRSRWRGRVSS